MACSIKAKPGLDLLMGHKPWIGSYKQQLKYHQASYSCFSKTPTLPILGLQSRDKAAMLVVKSIIFFLRIYIMKMCSLPRGEKCFVLDPARTWPP